jgi:hypothetical protein
MRHWDKRLQQVIEFVTRRKYYNRYYRGLYSQALADQVSGLIENGNLVVHRSQYFNMSNETVKGSVIVICENGNVSNNLVHGSLTALGSDVFLKLAGNVELSKPVTPEAAEGGDAPAQLG